MLFLTACALILCVVIFTNLWSRRRYYELLPGNKYRFYNILGSLILFDLTKDLRVQLLEVVGKLMKKFPNAQLQIVWFSYFPLILALKSDAVREILKENRMIEKSYQYDFLKPLVGSGLITSASGKWKSHRRLLNPCFRSEMLRHYLDTFNKKSQKLVKVLHKDTQKDFSYFPDPLALCALDTVCEALFSTTVEVSETDKLQISNSIKRWSSIGMARVCTFWLWPDFIFHNTKIGKDFQNNVDIVQGFVEKLIEEKKKRYINGERSMYDGRRKAMFDVLLEKHLETQEFSEMDVRDEVTTFLAAGHETVGLTAMWAIYLIGQYPEVQAKLHEEVDRVFGEDRDRAATEADLKDLRYMDCVLKECSRLYPAVPAFSRKVTEETKICGFTLPKGATCCVMIYFLHRDEKVFPDPEKFDPDRFSFENRTNIPEFAYIPFSAGPRNCIGYKFAEMELGTIMSSILRNFTVESLNKVLPKPGITLQPSEPVRIKVRSRPIITFSR